MLKPQYNESRESFDLDGFWDFVPGMDGWQPDVSAGFENSRKIAVPASWNEQCLDLYNHFGEGWYQKRFFVSRSWAHRRVFIHFGSVCQNAEVWLNGVKLGGHVGPHLPFEFEITDSIQIGLENRLTVLADGTLRPDALPPATVSDSDLRAGWSHSYPSVAYDFFPFSGIHRPVTVYSLSSEVFLQDVFVQSTHESGVAQVSCEATLSEAFHGEVRFSIEGAAQTEAVADERLIRSEFTIQSPRIWNIGQGELYELKVELIENGSAVDTYRVRFGIRHIEVTDTQFLLNGQPVYFKGFGKHEDFDVIGKGLCHALIVKDYDLMQWIGANSFRTSHYPYAEEWLDLADEQGILVISENPFVGLGPRLYNQAVLEKALTVVDEHMRRDRNHPSVVMWSLANEPNSPGCLDHADDRDACMHFYRGLLAKAREIDTSRPFTYAAHVNPCDNPMAVLFDVLCINKYYGWYDWTGRLEDGLEPMVAKLQEFYDAFEKPILFAEFGADAIAGEHHLPEVMFSEEYQSKTVETQFLRLLREPWFIGAHVWNFADFRVGQTLNRVIFNRKGVFTRARQPKLIAHTLKRIWSA